MYGTNEFFEEMRKRKMHSEDRILRLRRKEGENIKSNKGFTDNRLLNETNTLHCILNPRNNLWYFKYEVGQIPEPMKEAFTTFNAAIKHATKYYGNRGLEVIEIVDVHD